LNYLLRYGHVEVAYWLLANTDFDIAALSPSGETSLDLAVAAGINGDGPMNPHVRIAFALALSGADTDQALFVSPGDYALNRHVVEGAQRGARLFVTTLQSHVFDARNGCLTGHVPIPDLLAIVASYLDTRLLDPARRVQVVKKVETSVLGKVWLRLVEVAREDLLKTLGAGSRRITA
jgi:hypothetical protein